MINDYKSKDVPMLILYGRLGAAHRIVMAICPLYFELIDSLFIRRTFELRNHFRDGGRVRWEDSSASNECITYMQTDYFVRPTQQVANGVIGINHTPARIIDDHSIRNSLHHIFSLARVPSGGACQSIDAEEQARILDSQSDLLGELFQ